MKNSLGQRVKEKFGLETPEEKKERIARQRKTIEYFEKLHNTPEPIKIKNMTLPLEWLKKEFYKAAKAYYLKERRAFIVDDENRHILDILCRYFANDPSFEEIVENGQLQKGIMLAGNCGVGKTSFFEIMQSIGKAHNIPQLWFTNVSCLTITTKFNKENKKNNSAGGGESVIENYSKGKVYFDDLGSERIANDFGIRKELMREILEMRYNRFKAIGTKTFCSTNLTIKELVKKYDGDAKENHKRIDDRIYHMFNVIPLNGESRRF
ncbi:hypothetical protein ATE84_1246 [Aquimarina sp. MAR_2010_214]|uniref:hypothetical protein n=1 Tax=Aquimarina sp. MAR_2010_214 TaxID=1250026 RepID=UPI000C703302|nr:hypothetical protein [Aquimarina sp. MAR_2010_214]PKV49226.1 hypothetical protein ATE84_1246 [Aquimarina sp. MAR_2010_214]